MNKLTLNVLRTASLAALCLCLSSTSRAADKAAELMAAHGFVPIDNVAHLIGIGSTKEAVFDALGNADVVLPDGARLYRKAFHVANSAANGSLLVSFADGRVSGMRILSPAAAVSLVRIAGFKYVDSNAAIVASRR